MRLTRQRLRPRSGILSKLTHSLLNILLPILVYIFIRTDFFQLAVAVVFLSKWRIFAVKTRHWPANLRANAVDIIVGLSVVLFMQYSANTAMAQVIWGGLYVIWLLAIKPKASDLWVGLQAVIGQTLGFCAVFIVWPRASVVWLSFVMGVTAYFCARHFFAIFDEAMARASSYLWAYVVSSVTWLTSHWLLYYDTVAQPALLLSIVGYGLAALYYLNHTDRLSKNAQRQIVIMLSAITLFIIVFSDWSDKAI
jgi:hypothetical protein